VYKLMKPVNKKNTK